MRILFIIAGFLCICFIAVCIISTIENRKLKVTEYQIVNSKIPKEFQGYRMVVLADLHNACFGKSNEELIRLIQEQKPDCILIAGDMIVGKPEQSTEVPAQLIRELAKDYPIYYGKGNHELRVSLYQDTYGDLWENYQKEIDGSVTWLVNKSVSIEKNGTSIRLYGLDMEADYYKRFRHTPMNSGYLNDLLGTPKEADYTILLAHNPDYFSEYVAWGADLVLSGHLHGGMVRLPILGGMVSPMFHFFPKYDKGKYEEKGSIMLLSGGLGNHTFKFRVNNLPEILVVTLSQNEP